MRVPRGGGVHYNGALTAALHSDTGAATRMARITYISTDGTEKTVEVDNGLSVMQGAVNNGVSGIVAECGGACSCATCHVHVDPAWFEKLPPAQDMEKDMLEFVVDPQPTSRLSCQIKISDALDGLIVRTPQSQY
jgi:ferredoxin, 2Fe-2S